jgi:hypothetical protein
MLIGMEYVTSRLFESFRKTKAQLTQFQFSIFLRLLLMHISTVMSAATAMTISG